MVLDAQHGSKPIRRTAVDRGGIALASADLAVLNSPQDQNPQADNRRPIRNEDDELRWLEFGLVPAENVAVCRACSVTPNEILDRIPASHKTSRWMRLSDAERAASDSCPAMCPYAEQQARQSLVRAAVAPVT